MSDSAVLIVEMFSRLKECEENIKTLNQRLEVLEKNQGLNQRLLNNSNYLELPDEFDDEANDKSAVTRVAAREHVIKEIRKLKPNAVVRAANRKEGSGIFVSDSKGERKFKFYYSKCYDQGSSEKAISWSGIKKDDIMEGYDGYIFAIWSDDQLYVLLFTHQQITALINAAKKECDNQNKYHFSFTIKSDLQVFETRGPNNINVTYSLNNYQII